MKTPSREDQYSAELRKRAGELARRIWDIEVEGGITLYDRGIIELALKNLADKP